MATLPPITANELKGLNVFEGNSFNIRMARATTISEIVDFTVAGTSSLVFPTGFGVTKTVAQNENSYIGLSTSVKSDGPTDIAGDLSSSATMNGIVELNAFTLGGVTKSAVNDMAMISIDYPKKYALDVIKAGGVTTSIVFNFSLTDSVTVPIGASMTVSALITAINLVQDASGIFVVSRLMIGEGTELVSFEDGVDGATTAFNQKSVSMWRVAPLSVPYKATLAGFITWIIPKIGDALYLNFLASNKRDETLSQQYTGCRFLSVGMTYQNSNLTTVTNQIKADTVIPFSGTPAQAKIEDVDVVYTQTNFSTYVVLAGQITTAVISATNNFEWVITIPQNISNQNFNVPLSKYTDSLDLEMMFNEQSKGIFQTRVENNENISFVLRTTAVKESKEYNFFRVIKSLDCQPQYPAIADGVIGLTASGCTAIASAEDPYTSVVIATGDYLMDVTYTQEQIDKDFNL